jgi:hypothetical protein
LRGETEKKKSCFEVSQAGPARGEGKLERRLSVGKRRRKRDGEKGVVLGLSRGKNLRDLRI